MHTITLHRIALAVAMSAALVSSAVADQVVLKNGDRVTGSIVKKDENNLTIKADHFGTIVTTWDQVDSIVSDKPLYVVLGNGKTLHGTLAKTGNKLEVSTPSAKDSFPLTEIVFIRDEDQEKAYERLQHPGWTELWTGTATIGIAGTSGNSETLTFTTSFNVARATNTDKTSVYFKAIKSSAMVDGSTEDTAQAVQGGIAYNHNAGKRFYFNSFNDYEYDKFKDLDFRFVIGGGAGFHTWKNARSSLDLLAGISYNHSRFSTPLTTNSAEFYWGDEYSWKLNSAATLTQTYRMFNDLTNTGDYRVNFDIWLNTKIWKWLTWQLSLSDRYLSNPAPGIKSNDLLYTTGIGMSFGK
jgi:hypothetical protein